MAQNSFLNGLFGVVVGSVSGIALVLNRGWNAWWQVVVAIIIGGLVGLLVTDPKWLLAKFKTGFAALNTKQPAPAIKKGQLSRFVFYATNVVRCLLVLVLFSVFFCYSDVWLKACGVTHIPIVSFREGVLLMFATSFAIFFLLAPLGIFIMGPLYSVLPKKSPKFEKIMTDNGQRDFNTMYLFLEYYGFGETQKRMLKVGWYGAIFWWLQMLRMVVWVLANILFSLFAFVYLLREMLVGKRALVASVALAITTAAIFHSWWGFGCGVGFYILTFALSLIPFARISASYAAMGKVWHWEVIKSF
jgi:hypothetical protein